MCYCFSIGGIALGCEAKALTATIYIDYGFETTHSLFKIPVNIDNDIIEIHIVVVFKNTEFDNVFCSLTWFHH